MDGSKDRSKDVLFNKGNFAQKLQHIVLLCFPKASTNYNITTGWMKGWTDRWINGSMNECSFLIQIGDTVAKDRKVCNRYINR